MKIIFLLCVSHSGSTLIDLILDSHSQITGVGELNNLSPNNICTCRIPIQKCEIWSSILEKFEFETLNVKRRLYDFYLNKHNYYFRKSSNLLKMTSSNSLLEYNYFIYKKLLKNNHSKIIVDSSKDMNRVAFLSQHKKIKPIIIHLVRDGRGVILSLIKKFGHPFSQMKRWFNYNVKTEYLMRSNKFKHIFLKYEDFTEKPESCIRKILQFIGLKYEPSMLKFRMFEHHQVEGNRMRFERSDKIIKDIRWKIILSKKYRFIFNLLYGWLNLYYKYK